MISYQMHLRGGGGREGVRGMMPHFCLGRMGEREEGAGFGNGKCGLRLGIGGEGGGVGGVGE